MKREAAIFGIAAIAVIGLGACSSNSGSSSASSAAASGKNLAATCTATDIAVTNAILYPPTKEGVQKAVTELNTIKAQADPAAQAVLTPLIAGLQSIENVDFTASTSTSAPALKAYMTTVDTFQNACENAGVQMTAEPSASAS